jgi:hypothetical protein
MHSSGLTGTIFLVLKVCGSSPEARFRDPISTTRSSSYMSLRTRIAQVDMSCGVQPRSSYFTGGSRNKSHEWSGGDDDVWSDCCVLPVASCHLYQPVQSACCWLRFSLPAFLWTQWLNGERAIKERMLDGKPIPVAARSKAWVCCRSLAGIRGLHPAGGM